jgi:hypothetical protein
MEFLMYFIHPLLFQITVSSKLFNKLAYLTSQNNALSFCFSNKKQIFQD